MRMEESAGYQRGMREEDRAERGAEVSRWYVSASELLRDLAVSDSGM